MPQVQAMTVQAKDVHAAAAGARPAGRARRARLILIAPVAEVLTSCSRRTADRRSAGRPREVTRGLVAT